MTSILTRILSGEVPAQVQLIFRTYALLFFSPNWRLGAWICGATFLSPQSGLVGLGCVTWTLALRRTVFGDVAPTVFPSEGLNPLLVGLFLGGSSNFQVGEPRTLFLCLVWTALTFFLSRALHARFLASFGTTSHSLPAMIIFLVSCALARDLALPQVVPLSASPEVLGTGETFLIPSWLALTLKSFAGILFQESLTVGLLVFVGLLIFHPLPAALATLSLLIGSRVAVWLGGPDLSSPDFGFNLLLCGLALSSAYFRPGPASFLVACFGCICCGLLVRWAGQALPWASPAPNALPFNVVVPLLTLSLSDRKATSLLTASPAFGYLPDTESANAHLLSLRFPFLHVPCLNLPFQGSRTVTQGFRDAPTHRGEFQHALDFEGSPPLGASGEHCEDYLIFGTEVLAPCNAHVIYVYDQVPDNEIGQNNPDQNYGNVVILRDAGGCHVVLAHLMQGSAKVRAGQWVTRGDAVARVGNSGRSPVPHLHMNLQASSYLGTPTQAYGVSSYLESQGSGSLSYRTAGVPERGTVVRAPRPNATLRASILGWLPGTYQFQVQGRKQTTTASLCLDFDEWGRFRMTQEGSSGHLAWLVRDDCLFLVENTARSGSLLAVVGIVLSRLPFISEPRASWLDCVLTRPFRDPVSRWLRDFLEPFLGPETSAYRYHVVERQRDFAVHADAEPRRGPRCLPLEIRAELGDRLGPTALQWRDHSGHAFVAERSEFVPRTLADREATSAAKTFATRVWG